MKKIGLMILALFTTACNTDIKEDRFVNPLFYKVMEPVSSGTWYTQITPTEMIRNRKGDVVKQPCSLVENTMEAVTLKCEVPYRDELVHYKENPTPEDFLLLYRFVIRPDIEIHSGLFVYMYVKSLNESGEGSTDSLAIPDTDGGSNL